MSPSENIYFFLIGIPVVVAIIFIWLIFRKRKKIAIVFSSMLVIVYVGYYTYYPTLKENQHAMRYEQVDSYLTEKYPDGIFTISPKQYEEGHRVGDFYVNDIETPRIGATLHVDKEGLVAQTSWWSNSDNPTQREVWRTIEFSYGESYTLDKKIADITKEDEWINGELTAFALTINDIPAIALFNYSREGYGLVELKEEERDGFAIMEESGYIFIYVDERYQGETITVNLENGKEFSLNVQQQKGQLIVEKQK